MLKEEIESHPDIKSVVTVLRALETKGLENPTVASGFIRGFLVDTPPTDIDIKYTGTIKRAEAPQILRQTLTELLVDPSNYDIEGIWNFEEQLGITDTDAYLMFTYVTSIDSVYLAVDGGLHDPTGFGFEDAQTRRLRMNDFTKKQFKPYTDEEICYLCLRGCERIARNGWLPDEHSIELITGHTAKWDNLPPDRQTFLAHDYIYSKFTTSQLSQARIIYQSFGWGKAVRLAEQMV